MRPTTMASIIGLVIVGVIIADLVAHQGGTTAAANGLVSIEKPGLNALLGQTTA